MATRLSKLKNVNSLLKLRICSSITARYSNSLDPLALMLELPQNIWRGLISNYYPYSFAFDILDSSDEYSTRNFVYIIRKEHRMISLFPCWPSMISLATSTLQIKILWDICPLQWPKDPTIVTWRSKAHFFPNLFSIRLSVLCDGVVLTGKENFLLSSYSNPTDWPHHTKPIHRLRYPWLQMKA